MVKDVQRDDSENTKRDRSKEQVERRKKGGEDIFERDQQTEGEEQQTTSIRLTWSPPTWVKFLQGLISRPNLKEKKRRRMWEGYRNDFTKILHNLTKKITTTKLSKFTSPIQGRRSTGKSCSCYLGRDHKNPQLDRQDK
ncbi:hypothetical protein NC652_005599 [Populus alba x Populus x berolinensis]|nr:hypothetical protein NC652_005599 [Populus alba x Populus x berolinensis]